MKNNLLSASVFSLGLMVSSLIVANGAFAQAEPLEIQFPVAELGNCKDKDACKAYCDDASHADACIAFAEKNNLMSKDEIDTAKKFMKAGAKGPGGCTGKEACETYCDDIRHIDACIAFAEKTGILPPSELAEAKQVQAAIAKGVKPPACRGKKECDAYCEDSSHMKECIAFGEAAGFLQGRELEDARKMLTAIDNGAVPPPCKGREACEVYCSEPDHMEACMTFAQAAGFMTPEEAQNSEKMLAALKKGVKPPACRGKEACDAYCSEPAHTDECIQFAEAAGFMTEKEAQMAKKTGGKGPGGCMGKESCEAFCGNPENQETCINFAKENGMISEEDAGRMQEGQKKLKESMQNIPAEVKGCLETALGADTFEKIQSGQAMPSRDIGEKMGSCFSQMAPPQGQQGKPGGEQGRMPPPGEQFGRPIEPGQMPPDGQRPPGEQFAPGYPDKSSFEGPRPPEGTFAPGTYPNQPPLDAKYAPGTYPNQPSPNEQFTPGYPNQPPPPPPGEGTAGSAYQQYQQQYQQQNQGQYQEQFQQQYQQQQYQQQYQEQYQQVPPVPGVEAMMPPSGEPSPPQIPSVPPEINSAALPPPPIETTAPQSSNLNLKSSLGAVASFFGGLF